MAVLVMNGPPGSGKDCGATYLANAYGFYVLEMKAPLRELAVQMASLGWEGDPGGIRDELWRIENDRNRKENEVVKAFGNRTWRQFLIWISEGICKPIFGKDIFAVTVRKAIDEIMALNPEANIVFSDLGFPEELQAIEAEAGSTTIIYLHRSGCTFKGDSRSYISSPESNRRLYAIVNNGSMGDLEKELDAIMEDEGIYAI